MGEFLSFLYELIANLVYAIRERRQPKTNDRATDDDDG